MVQGRDRRPELGYKLALECRKNINYPMKNKNSKFNNMPVNPDGTLASTIESNHNTVKVYIMLARMFVVEHHPEEPLFANHLAA